MTDPGALRIERVALAFVLLTALAGATIKVDATDTPWQLATARYAAEHGWPATNTFSYSHPEHPLLQQYPLYQSLLYAVYQQGGWEGLSLLAAAGWLLVLLAWMRWAGAASWWPALAGGAALVLAGLERRFVLCPDILTHLGLVGTLMLIDAYRRRQLLAAALLPLMQWLMCNSHQLWPLGLAAQGCLLLHLVLCRTLGDRFGIAPDDDRLPIWPAALALVASLLATLGTPLGLNIVQVPLATWTSVTEHRADVGEFATLLDKPWALAMAALATGAGALSLWIDRRRWAPFDLLLLLLGVTLAAIAVRGLPWLAAISGALLMRALRRAREQSLESGVPELAMMTGVTRLEMSPAAVRLRTLVACVVLIWCVGRLKFRLLEPRRHLVGVQEVGVGLYPGSWPAPSVAFLREHRPPGRMLNLGWYSGNVLLWDLPEIPVLVDPRFEAYPRDFLHEVNRATRDDRALERLIRRWQPSWLIAEIRQPEQRARALGLLRGPWRMVHVDTHWIILVRDAPTNRAYLDQHALLPAEIAPADWLIDRPELHGQQLLIVASFLDELDEQDAAERLLSEAAEIAREVDEVRRELALLRNQQGRRLLRAGYPLRAATAYTRALEQIPDSIDSLTNRAAAYFHGGRYDQSERDLRRLIELAPELAVGHHNLGQLLIARGQHADAAAALDAAIAIEDSADTRLLRARARLGAARYQEALADLAAAEAVIPEPRRYRIDALRGEIYTAQGKPAQARAALQAALMIAPGSERPALERRLRALQRR